MTPISPSICIITIILQIIGSVVGHGYLATPISRNAIQIYENNLCSYSDSSKPFCGGNAQSWNIEEKTTGCGIMQGNVPPYVFENGDLSYSKWRYKTTYLSNQEVTMSVKVTAYHGGIFQFRIQDVGIKNDPNGKLWDELQPLIVNSYSPQCSIQDCPAVEPCVLAKTCVQIPRYAMTSNASTTPGLYTIRVQLPFGLSCDHCVLQWRYLTSNSCANSNPPFELSCGMESENFWNCADLAILPSSGDITSTPSISPATTTTTIRPTTSTVSLSTKSPTITSNCRSVSLQASDAWCQAVQCDPVYSAFCATDTPYLTAIPSKSPVFVTAVTSTPTSFFTQPPSKVPSKVPFKTLTPIISTKVPTVPVVTNIYSNYCGSSYSTSTDCHKACPFGQNSECGANEFCYTGVPCTVTPTTATATPSLKSTLVSTAKPAASNIPTKVPTTVITSTISPMSTNKPIVIPSSAPTAIPTAVPFKIPTPLPSSISLSNPYSNYCGSSYSTSTDCHKACPLGQNSECSANEICYTGVPCTNSKPVITTTPIPSYSQSPIATASKTPFVTSTTNIQYKGLWKWTWSNNKGEYPIGTNIAIAFSGWTDVDKALADSLSVKNLVPSNGVMKYISLGGGNENGRFSIISINLITEAIKANKFGGYDGIAYDIEEGDSGLASAFQTSFAAAKTKGLKVLVTVSHSQPYGISDAAILMNSLLADPNIDILSPQLYSSGYETNNDYTAIGTTWNQYATTSHAVIVPSIIVADYYVDAVVYFATHGVTLQGYVQWRQY